jgi:predicted nuclease with RNAse H fold
MHHVGIDLGCSATSTRPSSAVAVIGPEGRLKDEPRHFRRAAELVEILKPLDRARTVIAVDAPRSVPDHGHENYARRSCETLLQKHSREHVGSFAGVMSLFVRWYEIETEHFADVKVIETYPRAVWARLGVPHKPKDYKTRSVEICAAIRQITGIDCAGFSNHQVDAVLCAYTAWCYGRGQVEWHGRAGEGLMVLPSRAKDGRPTSEAEAVAEGFRRFRSQS